MALFAQQITLTGALQSIHFFDTYGIRVEAVGLLNPSSNPMQVSLQGALPVGNQLLLAPAGYMRIGSTGGIEQITFQGTAADVLQIFGTTEPSDTLPDIAIYAGGGGGGGGGGAPTTADYLLNSATVPGTLTNGVPVLALTGNLQFIRDLVASVGGSPVTVLQLGIESSVALDPGTGVNLNFNADDAGGNFTYGDLTFQKNAAGLKTDLAIGGYAGEQLAELRAASGGAPRMLIFPTNEDGGIFTRGTGLLYLGSVGASGVMVKANTVDVCKFTAGKQEFQAAATIEGVAAMTVKAVGLTLADSGGAVGVVIDATDIEFDVAGKAWTMNAAGDLTCPAGQIKGIADATLADDVPSLLQVQTLIGAATSKAAQAFGATTTGVAAFDIFSLLVGGATVPANDCSLAFPESTKFRAMSANIEITNLAIFCGTGPTGGSQTFELFKNGAATGFLVTLAAAATSGFAGPFSLVGVAGDAFEIRATNNAGCAPGAADVMGFIQYILS